MRRAKESEVRELLRKLAGRTVPGVHLGQNAAIPVPAFTRIEPYRSPDGQTEIDALAENGERWAVEVKWRQKRVGRSELDHVMLRVRAVLRIDLWGLGYYDYFMPLSVMDAEDFARSGLSVLEYCLESGRPRISYAYSELHAVKADEELAGRLRLPVGTAVLHTVETIYSATDEPVVRAYVYTGVAFVEGQEARRAASLQQVEEAWRAGTIPVLPSAMPETIAALRPTVIVDGIMAKHNTGTHIEDAALVIALGPGFVAGRDVHAVVETNRGHYLGRVIWDGSAQQDTGAPGEIGGQSRKRVVYAPCDGIFRAALAIGARVREGDLLGTVDGTPVLAPTTGVVRGLIHDGLRIAQTLKIGDVDPRGIAEHCFTVSDKALAIGGGVLEAVLAHLSGRRP